MFRRAAGKVIPLREDYIVLEKPIPQNGIDAIEDASIKRFPSVTNTPRLPLMIPDEILDYFGWVFCQGGFLNLHMTFEQFLAVVAAVSPSALCPEYDPSHAEPSVN